MHPVSTTCQADINNIAEYHPAVSFYMNKKDQIKLNRNQPRLFWLVVGLSAFAALLLPAVADGRPLLPSQSDQVRIAAAST